MDDLPGMAVDGLVQSRQRVNVLSQERRQFLRKDADITLRDLELLSADETLVQGVPEPFLELLPDLDRKSVV